MSPDKKYMGSKDDKNSGDLNLVPFKTSMPSMMPIGWIPVFSYNKLTTPVVPSNMMPNFPNIYNNSSMYGNPNMFNNPNMSSSPSNVSSGDNSENFPSDEGADNLYSYGKTSSNTSNNATNNFNMTPANSSSMSSNNAANFNTNNPNPGNFNANNLNPGNFNTNNPNPGNLNMNITNPNPNNLNMNNPNRNDNISDVLRNYFADLDEDTDLLRHCTDKRIDKIYAKIQEKNPEIIAMLIDNYKIPCPIVKAAIRKIIKLSLHYCK